ncbi:hypothetical protein [Tumebacillus permanentifrigoris]|uniref:Uncharacterized protein n=1 Tax=Tumebacillus permanentifrigoris TaxID=378543 RepID=A0A316D359_9BACL|nr:hypothetical protein [Tumebacillus permanentifrigoris]PWK05270.1 hypothetical protein C7459_12419 [Tumebacillus permanentifrigoris]
MNAEHLHLQESETPAAVNFSEEELLNKFLRYFQLKETVKDLNEQAKMTLEEIEAAFESMQLEDDYVRQLPNGEWAVVAKKATVKDVFDVDGLSNELLIAKDELKTPFDYSILTSQGKLKPDQISKHTQTEIIVKLTLAKRKRMPKKRSKKE